MHAAQGIWLSPTAIRALEIAEFQVHMVPRVKHSYGQSSKRLAKATSKRFMTIRLDACWASRKTSGIWILFGMLTHVIVWRPMGCAEKQDDVILPACQQQDHSSTGATSTDVYPAKVLGSSGTVGWCKQYRITTGCTVSGIRILVKMCEICRLTLSCHGMACMQRACRAQLMRLICNPEVACVQFTMNLQKSCGHLSRASIRLHTSVLLGMHPSAHSRHSGV